jgi:protein-disulfide isomerase
LKGTLKNANESKQNEIQALRVKHSPEVFTNLLFQEKKVYATPFEQELLIGNPDAPVRITMAASLGCGPCKDGFGKALKVVETYPQKANLAVRFKHHRTNNGQSISDQNPLLTYWLHHIHGKDNESERTVNLIRDWYSQMNNEKFKEEYSTGADGLSSGVEKLLHDHNSWFKTSEIQGTPTFFINGYQLPRHYKIDDLMMQIFWLEDFFRDEKNMQKIESEMYFSRKD